MSIEELKNISEDQLKNMSLEELHELKKMIETKDFAKKNGGGILEDKVSFGKFAEQPRNNNDYISSSDYNNSESPYDRLAVNVGSIRATLVGKMTADDCSILKNKWKEHNSHINSQQDEKTPKTM